MLKQHPQKVTNQPNYRESLVLHWKGLELSLISQNVFLSQEVWFKLCRLIFLFTVWLLVKNFVN